MFEAWAGGNHCRRNYCHRDSRAKLREDTDHDDDPFASDAEADLEEDDAEIEGESTISPLASHYLVYSYALCAYHTKETGHMIFEPIDSVLVWYTMVLGY